ncbi:hypothetical protein ACFQZC_21240 [Streptacidiphilus monticola]
MTGIPGAPASGVTAVVLNLTSANPSAAGFLTGYSSQGARPSASSLNFAAHENRSNLVTVPVGADGRIRIYAHVRTDVVADLVGYYAAGTKVTGGALLDPVTPRRLLDTRTTRTGPVTSGRNVKISLVGQVGSYAKAVLLNVTVVSPGATATSPPSARARCRGPPPSTSARDRPQRAWSWSRSGRTRRSASTCRAARPTWSPTSRAGTPPTRAASSCPSVPPGWSTPGTTPGRCTTDRSSRWQPACRTGPPRSCST